MEIVVRKLESGDYDKGASLVVPTAGSESARRHAALTDTCSAAAQPSVSVLHARPRPHRRPPPCPPPKKHTPRLPRPPRPTHDRRRRRPRRVRGAPRRGVGPRLPRRRRRGRRLGAPARHRGADRRAQVHPRVRQGAAARWLFFWERKGRGAREREQRDGSKGRAEPQRTLRRTLTRGTQAHTNSAPIPPLTTTTTHAHTKQVGHIEDVVVDAAARGQRLGQRLVDALVAAAKAAGCYKVILDCAEHNVAFYEKCGLTRKEVQMVRYLDR